MPDALNEPQELTIRKLELAWEIAGPVQTGDRSTSATILQGQLANFRMVYQHIHETIYGSSAESS